MPGTERLKTGDINKSYMEQCSLLTGQKHVHLLFHWLILAGYRLIKSTAKHDKGMVLDSITKKSCNSHFFFFFLHLVSLTQSQVSYCFAQTLYFHFNLSEAHLKCHCTTSLMKVLCSGVLTVAKC